MCSCHRKIQFTISSFHENLKIVDKKKEKIPLRILKRKTVNKNPNCNHNSNAAFFHKSITNIKINGTTEEIEEDTSDLLWLKNQNFGEKDELKSLKDLIIRLFCDPNFGERIALYKTHKGRYQPKNDPILINNGKNQNLGHEEIIIDGYKINKGALQAIKRLNPHHKAFIFSLLDMKKLSTQHLTRVILKECIAMNNKWSKNCYI